MTSNGEFFHMDSLTAATFKYLLLTPGVKVTSGRYKGLRLGTESIDRLPKKTPAEWID